MSSPILSIKDASISFAKKVLFENLSLNVFSGDRVCVIGKNGSGKTSLMNAIFGKIDFDSGERFIAPNNSIGYLEQDEKIKENLSIKDYITKEIKLDEHKLYLIDMICEKLKIDKNDFTHNLSGGQKRRANLAKSLIIEPDILLLDEPTNHLDLEIIQWLETYLQNYKGALILISHDRKFLEITSNKIFWIRAGSIKVNNEGYKKFDEWGLKIIEHENREMKNLEKKFELESAWLQTGVTGRRKRNIGRLHYLEELRSKMKSQKQIISANQSNIKIHSSDKFEKDGPQVVANLNNVSKFYGENKIIENLNIKILKGEKIGIIGKNGSGKSTFLKLLLKKIDPSCGTIKLARDLEFSYFDQDRSLITKGKTIKEILCEDGSDFVQLSGGKEKHVCGYLNDFLFDPKDVSTMASTLSGGQQNRLILAKVLANPKNFLILDEPTNDLDMDSLDILQNYLEKYQGTALIVSHDRDFLDNTVASVLAFEKSDENNEAEKKLTKESVKNSPSTINYHLGGYSDYENYTKNLKTQTQKLVKVKPAENSVKSNGKSNGKNIEKSKLNKLSPGKIRSEIDKISKKITKLEEKILDLNNELLTTEDRNSANLAQISIEISGKQAQIEEFEEKWLELEYLLEDS